MFCNWIENNVQTLSINNWRASLVPAAAVIPAPIVYIKVAVIKTLVVELKCDFIHFEDFTLSEVSRNVKLKSKKETIQVIELSLL